MIIIIFLIHCKKNPFCKQNGFNLIIKLIYFFSKA
jgi:hypothetical protein